MAILYVLDVLEFSPLVDFSERAFELSVTNRRLDLNVQKNELKKRREEMKYKPELKGENTERGYAWLYQKHVLQADEGCDFDFLKAR